MKLISDHNPIKPDAAAGAGHDPDPVVLAPIPTLRRLPAYLEVVRQCRDQGREWVSCTYLGERLKQDPTQIRKDVEFTGVTGRAKLGFAVADLIAGIEAYLGWDNTAEAFLAGAGHLGQALLGFPGFAEHGLNIVAAFDTDPAKIGSEIQGRGVLDLKKLPALARRMHIRIGIIAVPAPAAQGVADLMASGGIRGVWNFAPVRLVLPPDIMVENENMSAGFAVLSRKLAATAAARPMEK